MKKRYIIPGLQLADISAEMHYLLAASQEASVASFNACGEEYNENDVSYGKEEKTGLWDNLW